MLNLMKYNSNDVEIIKYNDKVLFNPYDVGNCLDMKEETVRYHIRNFNENQVIKIKKSDVGSTNNLNIPPSGRSFLTESGVYKLSFKSRKPEAEKFTDWVTDEVLPSIRKTGKYEIESEQLELEAYKLEKKTYKGKPVMTVRDIVYLTGDNKDNINWLVRSKSLGTLLNARTLRDFRSENNNISVYNRLNILFEDDVYSLIGEYKLREDAHLKIKKYFADNKLALKSSKGSIDKFLKAQRLIDLYRSLYIFAMDEEMREDFTEIISEKLVELGFLDRPCRDLGVNTKEGWNLGIKLNDYKKMLVNN